MWKKLILLTGSALALAFPSAALASSDEPNERIENWITSNDDGNFAIGIDQQEKHSGASSGYIESITGKRKDFGNLMQSFSPGSYLGKRIKLTAWVKTNLTSGTAQLWVRVDGNWETSSDKGGVFDNMDDRPIKGNTEWTEYSLVVDIPKTSNDVWFGLMLIGTGKVWLDDVAVEAVGKDVPLTGEFTSAKKRAKKQPLNLGFENRG